MAVASSGTKKGDYVATSDDDLDQALASEIAALGRGCLQGRKLVRVAQRKYQLDGKAVLMVLVGGKVQVAQGVDFLPLSAWLNSSQQGNINPEESAAAISHLPQRSEPTAPLMGTHLVRERLDATSASLSVTQQINEWGASVADMRQSLEKRLATFLETEFNSELEGMVKMVLRDDVFSDAHRFKTFLNRMFRDLIAAIFLVESRVRNDSDLFSRIDLDIKSLRKDLSNQKAKEDERVERAVREVDIKKATREAEESRQEMKKWKAEADKTKKALQLQQDEAAAKSKKGTEEVERLKAQIDLAKAEAALEVEKMSDKLAIAKKLEMRDAEELQRLRDEVHKLKATIQVERERAAEEKIQAVKQASQASERRVKQDVRSAIESDDSEGRSDS